MKIRSLLFALVAVLGLGAAASAQENYTLPAGAGNVVTLNVVITGQNGDACVRYNLARTCLQGAVCAAAAAPGGSGCNPTQARSAGVRIYPLTFAGREEFVTFGITLPAFLQMVSTQQAEDRRSYCESWNALTLGQRNTICTTAPPNGLGLAAGCNPGC